MSSRFLQQLVDNPDRGPGRISAWFIQTVIIVSILDFTIETMTRHLARTLIDLGVR